MKKNILLSLRNITRHLTEKNKIILFSLRNILRSSVSMLLASTLFTPALILPCFFTVSPTSALEYQDNVNVQFTFDPILSLSLSGDLSIEGLTPGEHKDSNTINVTVSTNNMTGYTLSATTGNENNATTNLLHPNNTNKFTSLSPNDSYPSFNDDRISPNTWGYSYSTDNGSNWSSYSGLPLYTASGTTLNFKNGPTEDTTNFKIAAKASTTQLAGNYTNTINFTAISNLITHYYMQDLTLSQCETLASNDSLLVYDKRDESDYTVRYINGACWMTQNLRITGIIPSEGSNFTGDDFNISAYSLDANDASYTNHCDSTNGYNYACSKDSGNATTGVWYNYYAATAGTISGSSNMTPATEDICPKSWYLPTYDSDAPVGSIQDIFNSLIAFQKTIGGYYKLGATYYTQNGYWWSATNKSIIDRYVMKYNGYTFLTSDFNNMNNGLNVRCLRSS